MTIYAFSEADGTLATAITIGTICSAYTAVAADITTNGSGVIVNAAANGMIFKSGFNRSIVTIPAGSPVDECAGAAVEVDADNSGFLALLDAPDGNTYTRVKLLNDGAWANTWTLDTPIDSTAGEITIDLELDGSNITCDLYLDDVLHESLGPFSVTPNGRTGSGFYLSSSGQITEWDNSGVPPAARRIDSVDGDNSVRMGQTFSVAGVGLQTNPASPTATLGGESLTIVDWNGGVPSLSADTLINLLPNQAYTLVLNDGIGDVSIANITLEVANGWEVVVYDGSQPSAESRGFVYWALNDAEIGITLETGDQIFIESFNGMSVGADGQAIIDEGIEPTGSYRVYDLSTSTFSNTSTYSFPIDSNANNAPTGKPVINGTATQGETLNVDTSGIADLDGLGTFSYQWQRDAVNISGATSNSHTLTQADVGAVITIIVSYTDGATNSESIVSDPTSAVANVNDPVTGSVTIDDTAPFVGDVLSASHNLVDIDGLGTIGYQWLADGAPIAGATASTYTVVNADIGSRISVTASFTDMQGTNESATSAETDIVPDIATPVITLVGGDVVRYVGSGYSDPGYSADDGYGTDITADVVITGTVDPNTPGVYPIQYDVTNEFGRDAIQRTRNVSIIASSVSGSPRPLVKSTKRSMKSSLRSIL